MAKETAEQRARRELAALEKKGQTPAKPPVRGGRQTVGKPAVSNLELSQRQFERDRKRLEKIKAAEKKAAEEAKRKAAEEAAKPSVTPRERGVSAGQNVRTSASRTVAPVVKPATTAVQTTAGFMEGLGIKPTKKGLIKTAIALGASYLGYKGFEAWQDSNKPAPAPTPTKGVAPTGSPQRAAPSDKPAEPPKKESKGMLIGMSTKQLEDQLKKARVKNRYTA